MNETPELGLVTVIMPVYNASPYISSAINSILNQTYQNLEFLIFNDASTDNSAEVIKSFVDHRIKYFHSDTKRGYLHYLNEGIKMAKGEYIARMDADDISHSKRIEQQVSFLQSHNDYAIVGSGVNLIDKQGNYIKSVEYPIDYENIKAHLLFGSCFAHPSVTGRTAVFREFYYSTDHYTAEDYHLWSRISAKYHIANLPVILFDYRIHDSNISIHQNERQKEVVRKVYHMNLSALLDRNMNESEIRILQNFVCNPSKDSVNLSEAKMIIRLLHSIYQANRRKNIYHNPSLISLLNQYWNIIFCSSYSANWGLFIMRYFFSPLNKLSLNIRFRYVINCILRPGKLTNK